MADLKQRIDTLKQKFNLDDLRKKIKEIEAESAQPNFWQDHEKASVRMKQMADWQKDLVEIKSLDQLLAEGKEKALEKKLGGIQNQLNGDRLYSQVDLDAEPGLSRRLGAIRGEHRSVWLAPELDDEGLGCSVSRPHPCGPVYSG